ncbi:MAG: LysM peptidoglycan-binding domain-containing protein [Anaerolineae bacterium]|nr:LysM peptidoglycan-binding domain-containing protein [Anaerolineae bacterium]
MKPISRILFIGFILLAFMMPVSPVFAAGGGWDILGQHTVKSGETLFCIGRAYGVDPYAIATQNSVVHANLIHPGLVLDIPDAVKSIYPGPVCTAQFGTPVDPVDQPDACGGCTCAHTYTILYGNTLTQIAALYGADMWSIAECNCIFNLNFIRAGDTLCIP